MGFLSNLLKGKSNELKSEQVSEKKVNWINITSVDQLDEIVEVSKKQNVLIFKHSTRCSISTSVLNKFEKNIKEGYQLYFLDLLSYRAISVAIADKFFVTHQSPQVLIIKRGQATQHASHYNILDLDL